VIGGRSVIDVATPAGGWAYPWPNVAEIEAELPHTHWTLIGGLMVQLHAINRGLAVVRPTNDVDIVVHVETGRGRPRTTAQVLTDLGYEIQPEHNRRESVAHRFRRDRDTVDVVVADHAAPRVLEPMAGNRMVPIEGGTQALRRTVNARLEIDERNSTVSVPDPYGALIIKSAAHKADSRDPERHLLDAAVLLACIDDPYAELERPASGSDRSRLIHLRKYLDDPLHPAWLPLDARARSDGQAALEILVDG
jgi:hypothetical protein